MTSEYYSINNLLTLEIKNIKRSFVEDLNNPFLYFKTDTKIENPDIILNIGKFNPSKDGCYLVDHKYHIRDNYFYCKDSGGKANWEFEIFGFEKGNTTINFSSKIRGLRENILFPALIYHNVILKPIIEYKLSLKGYYLIHAASVERNGNAYIFSGRGSSSKTSITMDLIRKGGYNFIADERVIVDSKGNSICFPMHPTTFDYRIKHLESEDFISIKRKINVLLYLFNNSKYEFSITKSSQTKTLFNLVRKNSINKVTIRKNDNINFIQKLIANEMSEMIKSPSMGLVDYGFHFFKYLLAYSYIFPKSEVSNFFGKMENCLELSFKNVDVYNIEIPQNYDEGTFNAIHNFISSLD
ncbi:hypothetical protein [Methanobacterium oryzae]|uniref:hypothetical protein n=1 Tax=Methanobacterium oryzae TaxID=69540 RepID=UPI003D240CC4